MKSKRLSGQVAIVTGGASGIGEGICSIFASEGAKVAIVDLDSQKAQVVADHIGQSGGQALALEVDVTNNPGVEKATERVIREFGTVNIMVNCAGWNKFASADALTYEDWDRLVRTNLYGPWNFCHAVIPEMMKNSCGKIINIGSAAGILGIPKAVPYSAAKHGLVGLTRSLAIDLGPHSINVNCICPATIETPMVKQQTKPVFREEMTKRIPLARLGQVSDIAYAALFLASSESDWITGVVLPVDGGLTCCIRAHHHE